MLYIEDASHNQKCHEISSGTKFFACSVSTPIPLLLLYLSINRYLSHVVFCDYNLLNALYFYIFFAALIMFFRHLSKVG